MLTIGLTGGIASGKSTVARHLADRGAVVADADQIAHEVISADPDLIAALAAAFGKSILSDEGVDRSALGEIVFGRPERLAVLNRLVHPHVIEYIEKLLAAWRAKPPATMGVVQVPLLVEAGMEEIFDVIVVVVSSPEKQARRLIEAGHTEAEAVARLRSQIQDWERLPYADLTLINKGNLKLLEEQAEVLFQKLTEIVAEHGGLD